MSSTVPPPRVCVSVSPITFRVSARPTYAYVRISAHLGALKGETESVARARPQAAAPQYFQSERSRTVDLVVSWPFGKRSSPRTQAKNAKKQSPRVERGSGVLCCGWGTLRHARGALATPVTGRAGPAPPADGADAAARPAKLAPRAKSPADSQLRDGTRLLPM